MFNLMHVMLLVFSFGAEACTVRFVFDPRSNAYMINYHNINMYYDIRHSFVEPTYSIT